MHAGVFHGRGGGACCLLAACLWSKRPHNPAAADGTCGDWHVMGGGLCGAVRAARVIRGAPADKRAHINGPVTEVEPNRRTSWSLVDGESKFVVGDDFGSGIAWGRRARLFVCRLVLGILSTWLPLYLVYCMCKAPGWVVVSAIYNLNMCAERARAVL